MFETASAVSFFCVSRYRQPNDRLGLNEVRLRLAGEFFEPSELFLGIVPGVEANGVGHNGALALGEGKGGVATSLPEGEKLLVAHGVEGGEMAEWVEAACLFFESEEHHLVDTSVYTLA